MRSPHPQIYCPNLDCAAPLNEFGSAMCGHCQTPLIYRYVWAVGEVVLRLPVGSHVEGRYYIKAPQIWLDTQPGLLPEFPPVDLPDEMLPYLHLYPYRLHVPEIHGITPKDGQPETASLLLLENMPLDAQGNLYPTIAQAWTQTTAVRQVYWLWQLLQLWTPLAEQGVSASLLAVDNICVEGWRVRLCQFFQDQEVLSAAENQLQKISALGLSDLANVWLGWVDQAQPAIAQSLQEICLLMKTEDAELGAIAARLNQLLLEQAAQLPLRLQLAGVTDPGPQQDHNEDTCYPLTGNNDEPDGIFPRLAVVCDGIGGHEGGEVASQLAVQSLKLQIQALLAEVAEQAEWQQPPVIAEQLTAVARLINNLISSQNDAQEREARRRMGTTLIMGLQLPQVVALPGQGIADNSHELYLVNVGDSRAYWITPHYCHRLTVDDDVAAREVRMGRLLYHEAILRSDAGALIQALGTRDSEFLYPTVHRFILEEDGVLLLCSDGLSDNGQVEESWATVMEDLFKGQRSLAATAKAWLDLANQKNGHDNVSVVLLHCQVSSPLPPPAPEPALPEATPQAPESDWSASARELLQDAEAPHETVQSAETAQTRRQLPSRAIALSLIGLLLIGSGVGLAIWSHINPSGFQQLYEQLLPKQ